MRFGLRDILWLTAAVALWAAVIQSQFLLKQKRSQLLETAASFTNLESVLEYRKRLLNEQLIQSRLEELQEYQTAIQAASVGFERVQQKYSQLQPVEGKVAYRVAPALNSVIDFRLHIPESYPVFLRCGICSRDSKSYALDAEQFKLLADFPSVGPWETQLQPGEQRLVLSRHTQDKLELMRIELNGEILHQVPLPEGFRNSGHSHPSGRTQLDFPREQLPTLIKASISNKSTEKANTEYHLVIWLSSTHGIPNTSPFKLGQNELNSDSRETNR
jgi:hypothetical protein